MDLELETYVDIVMENQEYRDGIFSKYWSLPTVGQAFSNILDLIRGR